MKKKKKKKNVLYPKRCRLNGHGAVYLTTLNMTDFRKLYKYLRRCYIYTCACILKMIINSFIEIRPSLISSAGSFTRRRYRQNGKEGGRRESSQLFSLDPHFLRVCYCKVFFFSPLYFPLFSLSFSLYFSLISGTNREG